MSQQVLDAPAAAAPVRPLAEFVDDLHARMQVNRRHWRSVILLEALGLAISAPLAFLWIVFFLDTSLHLPVFGRLLATLGFFGIVYWAARHFLTRWRQLDFSEDQVALAVERRTPVRMHNRLINAVQLSRPPAHFAPPGESARSDGPLANTLTEAVVLENCNQLRQMQLEQAAQFRPALMRMGLAAGLILFGIVFWVWQPARFANAAARIFLPFASIEPLYRTKLVVEPGDIEAQGNVPLRITIQGERPESLTILRRQQGKLTSEVVAMPAEGDTVEHLLRDVNQPITYAVRGGDYTSPYYQITLPPRVGLARVRVKYIYPEYTKQADKSVESAVGELEALTGTTAKATFVFDQPVTEASMTLEGAANAKPRAVALTKQGDGREWTAEFTLADAVAYRIDATHKQSHKLGPFSIRLLRDQEPKLELTGLDQRHEIAADAVVPLQVTASDDFGLQSVGVFYRKQAPLSSVGRGAGGEGRSPNQPPASSPEGRGASDEGWTSIATWQCDGKTSFRTNHELLIAALGLVEGDKIELALRAIDTAPERHGRWTTGAIYDIVIGGDGALLQLTYEQILRSEQELKTLLKSEQGLHAGVLGWQRKLEGVGDIKWDDPKNIQMLHAAVAELHKTHEKLRAAAGSLAKNMVPQAGNLRLGVAMLADTEMVRLGRVLQSVPERAQPQAKQSALAEGRVTLDRIVRSLEEIQEQYANFRTDWELANMVPFTKMLAERQTKLRDLSRTFNRDAPAERVTGPSIGYQRTSSHKRQTKLVELCQLIQPVFTALAARLQDDEPTIAKAFTAAAGTLAGDALLKPMRQAADDALAGTWTAAASNQSIAAEMLTALHAQLRQAQLDAAQKALAALREKAKSDLQAQKELEKLAPGSADAFLKDFPEEFKLQDLMRIREVAGAKKANHPKKDELDPEKMLLLDVDKKQIELEKDSGVRQDPYSLTLGKVAEATPILKMYKDKEKNAVKPFMQEEFDDLVGKLLEEADELDKKYQTINLSTNQNNNDPGDISKVGGALNSTGAVTATGNKKPPTTESGGLARTGRQGARAYGMVADQDTFNRKGRDKALDGQERIADQAGLNKMHNTDENQKDVSTGVGGKKIASDDTHFSLHDTGKWKDEYMKRMEKPQAKQYIVERQDGKFDAKMAAQMRDLTSKQEQIIERLKAIKKDLKNLYLPTEHLDELAATLQTNLESLKDRPEAELFRLQAQTLEQLRGALRVFRHASASFQPSLPRDRQIRGRVLDEPSTPALPGYEEATKGYYLRLANQ